MQTTGEAFMQPETTLPITSDADIVAARTLGRMFVLQLGFPSPDATLVATAIAELARNIVLYAERGEIVLKPLDDEGRRGVLVIARDQGPGIAGDYRAPAAATARHGAGCHGLFGLSCLVDECEIVSHMGQGTTVAVKKWLDSRPWTGNPGRPTQDQRPWTRD
jgi:serine/threonine-protein kinase RsbT